MSEKKKLSMEDVEQVSGGWIGYDKYTVEEYNKAGVTHEKNFIGKDRYYHNGEEINQDMATKITDEYFDEQYKSD